MVFGTTFLLNSSVRTVVGWEVDSDSLVRWLREILSLLRDKDRFCEGGPKICFSWSSPSCSCLFHCLCWTKNHSKTVSAAVYSRTREDRTATPVDGLFERDEPEHIKKQTAIEAPYKLRTASCSSRWVDKFGSVLICSAARQSIRHGGTGISNSRAAPFLHGFMRRAALYAQVLRFPPEGDWT